MLPKGIIARKVRASQGRITDNVRLRRLTGKCNRNIPPEVFLTSAEAVFKRRRTIKEDSFAVCTVKSISGKDGKAR